MNIVKKSFLSAVILLAVFPSVCNGSPKRVSQIPFDLGKVMRIYLTPRLMSYIELPEAIKEVPPNVSQDIEMILSKDNPKRIHLYLKKGTSKPTNLILHGTRRSYVFDVIPSLSSNHQDAIIIPYSYGRPAFEGARLEVIAQSHTIRRVRKSKIKQRKRNLIDSSEIAQKIGNGKKEMAGGKK